MILADRRSFARWSSLRKRHSSRTSSFQYARRPSKMFAPRLTAAEDAWIRASAQGTIDP